MDIEGFLASVRVAGRSEATVRAYAQDLRRWERVGGDPAAYLTGPPASRARRYSSLRAYWRWAEAQHLEPGPFPLAGWSGRPGPKGYAVEIGLPVDRPDWWDRVRAAWRRGSVAAICETSPRR